MENKLTTPSKYFLKRFKSFYSVNKVHINYPFSISEDVVYFYNKNLFDKNYIKDLVYKKFINNSPISSESYLIEYIDLEINTLTEQLLYNFVTEYVKLYNLFKFYRNSKRDLEKETMRDSTVKYKNTINIKYDKTKIDYLKHRVTFKTLFKNNKELGQYYLYLANIGISDLNINIKEYKKLL